MEFLGIGVDRSELEALNAEMTAEAESLAAQIQEQSRRGVQRQLNQEAARDLVREAGAEASEEDQDGFSTDQATLEKLVGEHPIIDQSAALSRGREAPIDLRSVTSCVGCGRRSNPRQLQSDRRPDRPVVERESQPSQHPGANRAGPELSARPSYRRRPIALGRRLQPDRAALHRPSRR